ncbi:hypothetical protein ACWDRR_33170 [Kitasatospora sp. NPDC003701]
MAAVLGTGPAVLLTVEDATAARAEAAAVLARHFERASAGVDVSVLDTEEFAYEAMRHRVLQDALGSCRAGLGDAVREADAKGLYGRGRSAMWIELSASWTCTRDTMGQIRAGEARQDAAAR